MTLLTPFQLTPLGLFHTILSVVCLVAALAALYRDKAILPRSPVGRFYLVTLWITTLTGFPIFRTGKIGPPFVLGIVIVIVLLVALLAGRGLFGRASARVETLCYSFTVFLFMIPTFTETLTRVPPSAPWVSSPEAPIFPPLYGALFVLFLIGAVAQLRAMRSATRG